MKPNCASSSSGSADQLHPDWKPRRTVFRPELVRSSSPGSATVSARPGSLLFWWRRLAPLAALIALLLPGVLQGASVTVSDAVVNLASSAGGAKNYTFTDATSGQSVTVALTLTSFSSDPAAVLSLLDGNSRVGVGNPNVGGDGNLIVYGEGVNFAASLVSASAGVNAGSVTFRVQGLGLRAVSGTAPLYWQSSATASNAFTLTGETVNTLDAAGASLNGSSYAGQLGFSVNDGSDAQLSDAGTIAGLGLVLNVSFTTNGVVTAPLITSWFTAYSGKYARIYTSDTTKNAGTAATVWTNGTTSQALPVYSGVQEISSSINWVYIRSSGLGSHTMGPWYLDAQHQQLFPNFPTNQKVYYRLPRTPSVPGTKTANNGGAIGYFVDGVAMFNSWDAYYWNGSAEVQSMGNGTGYWNRDAYVNEGQSFDGNNAHQAGGQHHYHANPPALRFLLGDHVDFNSTTKVYSESTAAPTKHSPILGWVADGYPIYGPYGYANAADANSGVRRMISGYVLRNGQSNTVNLASTGRTTLPQWAVRLYQVTASQAGPTVSPQYPLGRYMEDNDHLGDLGYTAGVDYDLDEYNGRFCVTPEFPGGTYAYFVAIKSDGTPAFPYNIGRGYYGSPTGGAVTTLNETVTTNFVGGTNMPIQLGAPAKSPSTVTLMWSAVDGGNYDVESRNTLGTGAWQTKVSGVSVTGIVAQAADTSAGSAEYYRIKLASIAAYDPVTGTVAGGGGGGGGGGGQPTPPSVGTVTPNTGTASASVTVTINLNGGTNLPPANATPTSVTLGTATGTAVSYDGSAVTATFTLPVTTGLQNIVITFPAPPAGGNALVVTGTNVFTVNVAGGGGGQPTPPSVGTVTPNSGTASASVTVTVSLLGGTNLPPANATPTSVTLGSATGTAVSYDGSAVTATFTLPVTTGLQNIVISFPAPPAGGNALVITGTNVFTVNAAGGGGTSTTTAPNGSATRGTTVTVTITLPTNPPLPPLLGQNNQTLLPQTVTLAGITGTNVSRPAQGTVIATFVIPANAPTGAQNVVVTFPPPQGMQAATYTLTGGVTLH
ncbi:MAG: YHYH protein [Proteobacteria bacterium]|nr:YHYH protein [Pseudomonadota bacterium]